MVENDISSIQNPKIKLLTALQKKSAERRSRGVFVVEGQRELQHCVEAGFEVESLFVCKELFTGDFDVKNAAVYTVSPSSRSSRLRSRHFTTATTPSVLPR